MLVATSLLLAHASLQNGYGAFSVDPWGLDRVKDYINKQHEHHSGKSFKEEYMGLLEENGAVFDERYVWR